MTKLVLIFFIMLALTSASQSISNIPKEIVGKWVLKKYDLTIDNKKELTPIEDTSFYAFLPTIPIL